MALQMALVRPDIRDPALQQVATRAPGGLDKNQIEALDAEIIRLNPDCKQHPEGVCGRLELNADGSLHTYDLHGKFLTQLPDAICMIEATGNLDLGGNRLESLPTRFGNIKVGGHLWLNNNSLQGFPPGFANVSVGRSLVLDQCMAHGVAPPTMTDEDFPNVKHLLHPNVYQSTTHSMEVGCGPGLP